MELVEKGWVSKLGCMASGLTPKSSGTGQTLSAPGNTGVLLGPWQLSSPKVLVIPEM